MRIIARLDVQPPHVVKPIQFEGLRKLGYPNEIAKEYYLNGADEIFYIDIVSSLYQRSPVFEMIEMSSKGCFAPFAAGGGIRSVEDCIRIIKSGADKVVINTHAIKNPNLIKEASLLLGSQSVVVHIEAKKHQNWWECYTDCGRIPSGLDVLSWAKEVEILGAGEIVISSVDRDGLQQGFDIELVKAVCEIVTIPVVAASGAGNIQHILDLLEKVEPSAIAIASALHYGNLDLQFIKSVLRDKGFIK